MVVYRLNYVIFDVGQIKKETNKQTKTKNTIHLYLILK